MRKNGLTLLITIHSQFESVSFFDELIERSKFDKSKIIFAFDCEEKNIPDEYFNIAKKYRHIISEKNVGKLKTVINSTGEITTKFFKIIDQDDSLFFDGMKDIERELSLLAGNELVKHKACKIKSNGKNFLQSLDEEIIARQIKDGYDPMFIQGTNCNTIYPTEVIEKMSKAPFTTQSFHNDILLSNFVLALGGERVKINSKFYIQFHQKGQTSVITTKRSDCIPELYQNYLTAKSVYPQFDFNKIMLGSKILHKIYITNFTKWYLKDENRDIGVKNYKEAIKLMNDNFKTTV